MSDLLPPFYRSHMGEPFTVAYDEVVEGLRLNKEQAKDWAPSMHCEKFRGLVRSIARERAYHIRRTVMILAPGTGLRLATCRWQTRDLWKGLTERQRTVMQVVGRGGVRREMQKRHDADKTRMQAWGMRQTLIALEKKGYLTFDTEYRYTELWCDYLEQSEDKEGRAITLQEVADA